MNQLVIWLALIAAAVAVEPKAILFRADADGGSQAIYRTTLSICLFVFAFPPPCSFSLPPPTYTNPRPRAVTLYNSVALDHFGFLH